MAILNLTSCGHCKGKGKCQCDECQKIEFGETFRTDGHYATCAVCGGAGKVAVDSPTVECAHCQGTGKCQCDGCQKKAFGETRWFDGHYARCAACGGSGRARIRYV
jgi:hypothetical protein